MSTREPFIHLEYDEESKEYVSTIVGSSVTASHSRNQIPMNMVVLSEDEKRTMSANKPQRKGHMNHFSKKPSMPTIFQTYMGALTIVGLYVVFRYTQKN